MAIPLCGTCGTKPETLERIGDHRPGCRHRPDRRACRTTDVHNTGPPGGCRRMNLMARDSVWPMPDQASRTGASSRDAGIDTMRGIAILMVIGIHSLQQP